VQKEGVFNMKEFEDIIILIPAYKPANELIKLVLALTAEHFSKFIVVDDGSGKEYSDVFGALPDTVVLLKHPENRGKGSALKTGLKYIYGNYRNSLGVITCDADAQHTPEDICKVAQVLAEKESLSLILGSRRFQGDVPFRSAFGNRVTKGVFHLASGIKLHDTQTGLRAFSFFLIPRLLSIPGERYEYEMNMLLEAAKRKIPITEVEIQTVYMDGNKSSHFHTIRDSAIIYGNIVRFSLSSLVCFGIDFALLFLFRFLTGGMPYSVSLLISVICARAVSSFVNYCLNRHVVFQKDSQLCMVKYYILVLCMIGFNYGMIYCFSSLLAIPLFWSKLITEILLFALSYLVQKKWIFTEECFV